MIEQTQGSERKENWIHPALRFILGTLIGALLFISAAANLFLLFRQYWSVRDRWVQDIVFFVMTLRGSLLYPVWRKLIDPDNLLYLAIDMRWVALASLPSAFVGAMLSSRNPRGKPWRSGPWFCYFSPISAWRCTISCIIEQCLIRSNRPSMSE